MVTLYFPFLLGYRLWGKISQRVCPKTISNLFDINVSDWSILWYPILRIGEKYYTSLRGKRSSLFRPVVSDVDNKVLLHSQPWGLYYKTVYGSNFCRIIIGQCVCHLQSLPPQSNICGQGQEPIIISNSWEGLHSGRLQPRPQILDQGGSD